MKHFPVRITSAVTVISLATLATFATLATGVVRAAENFPTKPVRLVVAFPIAGATDILARHFALKMSEQLGYQMIVDNRPGAGGTIGSKIVSGAIADGYTLTMGTTSTHAIGPHLYSSKPYDPINDFTAVTQMCVSPTVMMVAAQVPAKSLKEFIALAKAQPGKLNFGSSGIGRSMSGSTMHHSPTFTQRHFGSTSGTGSATHHSNFSSMNHSNFSSLGRSGITSGQSNFLSRHGVNHSSNLGRAVNLSSSAQHVTAMRPNDEFYLMGRLPKQ